MKTAYLQEQQIPDLSMSVMENKNEIEELWSSESEFKEDTAVKKKNCPSSWLLLSVVQLFTDNRKFRQSPQKFPIKQTIW